MLGLQIQSYVTRVTSSKILEIVLRSLEEIFLWKSKSLDWSKTASSISNNSANMLSPSTKLPICSTNLAWSIRTRSSLSSESTVVSPSEENILYHQNHFHFTHSANSIKFDYLRCSHWIRRLLLKSLCHSLCTIQMIDHFCDACVYARSVTFCEIKEFRVTNRFKYSTKR